jgi:hypothetical protein
MCRPSAFPWLESRFKAVGSLPGQRRDDVRPKERRWSGNPDDGKPSVSAIDVNDVFLLPQLSFSRTAMRSNPGVVLAPSA